MYTVKELKEIGYLEGFEEGREEGLEEARRMAVYALSKQLGISFDEARKVYEQSVAGFDDSELAKGVRDRYGRRLKQFVCCG